MTAPAQAARRLWLRRLLVLTWVGALVATHLPAERLPEFHTSDKILHTVGYAVLAAVFWMTLLAHGSPFGRRVLIVGGVLALYGALDEITQPLVNRYAAVDDWCFDVIGVAIALTVAEAVLRTRRAYTKA